MQDKSMTIKSTALKVIDLMVRKKFHELPDDIAFCSNIFMIFGLPAHRIKENPAFWIKKSNSYDLIITRDPKYEIPYGCYARMNQIFIDQIQSNKKEFLELTQDILSSNLLVIGETHGVKENAFLYYSLFKLFEFDTIVLGYPIFYL